MININKFEDLLTMNINDHVEKRTNGTAELSYLSWSYAWSEFKKAYPDATYDVIKYQNKDGVLVPYMFDENTGYMVNTRVTADGLTYEMWLPVMNSTNKALLNKSYTITTKKGGQQTVEAATMFDINKTIMRCLVKNIAMFGLGLYLYAGEDMPDDMVILTPEEKETKTTTLADEIVACRDQDKLTAIYQANKKVIQSNPDLLTLITNQGRMLKGIAA